MNGPANGEAVEWSGVRFYAGAGGMDDDGLLFFSNRNSRKSIQMMCVAYMNGTYVHTQRIRIYNK